VKPPIVGIEADVDVSPKGRRFGKVYEAYYEAVAAAGGYPVLLPSLRDAKHVAHALSVVDALVFPGGDDMPANEYGQETLDCPRFSPVDETRFRFGRELMRAAVKGNVPTLGVCYGHQLLNVALGGDMVQDIPLQVPQALAHKGEGQDSEHEIALEAGSRLAKLVGGTGVRVNSSHHQSVQRAGDGLRIVARSQDGVVEAVEAVDQGRFLVGVQWHPERMGPGAAGWRLFEALVEACRRPPPPRSGGG
jgi:putative glutamine amidotransferase